MLPPRIPKKAKRASHWRSQVHCNHVRSHACCRCGSMAGIEVAHVRLGSGAGMGQKPDDWNAVSLCRDCHFAQHRAGEETFWGDVRKTGKPGPDKLIPAFIAASPRRREIEQVQRERDHG